MEIRAWQVSTFYIDCMVSEYKPQVVCLIHQGTIVQDFVFLLALIVLDLKSCDVCVNWNELS